MRETTLLTGNDDLALNQLQWASGCNVRHENENTSPFVQQHATCHSKLKVLHSPNYQMSHLNY